MEEIDIGHIIKVLSAKDQEYEGRIEELELGILKYPHQVLIPATLFESQEHAIKDLQAKIKELESLIHLHHDGEFKTAKQVIELQAKVDELKNEVDSLLQGHAGDKGTVKMIGLENIKLKEKIAMLVEALKIARYGVNHTQISYDKNLPEEEYGVNMALGCHFPLTKIDEALAKLRGEK